MAPQVFEIINYLKKSGKSFAIAVEGGGLRGVVSLGMLSAIKDLGLENQVISLSGTSAGAINASYFLQNKIEDALELYRKMASPQFIQIQKWPNAMNLNYLFNEQIAKFHPLDSKKLKTHSTDFFVTATKVSDGLTNAIKVQKLKETSSIIKILRASASAPLYCTNKELIEGELYNDGHIQMAIPYQPLLEYKVEAILCLMTQKKGYQKKESFMGKVLQILALRKYSKEYQKSFSKSSSLYNQQLQKIKESPRLIPVYLDNDDFIISKLCKDPQEVDLCFNSTRDKLLKGVDAF